MNLYIPKRQKYCKKQEKSWVQNAKIFLFGPLFFNCLAQLEKMKNSPTPIQITQLLKTEERSVENSVKELKHIRISTDFV